MFGLSPGHLLLLLLIVVLIFGTKKLGNIGGDVASAIKNFRKGLQDDDHSAQPQLKADPEPVSTPASTPPSAGPASAGGSETKRENTP
ncbi:MAG: twin-arginine translocase TatA/TatE family subunit [Rudaea sp.]|nr:twin-arginine translocase TatA/TatE family subunit [Rudaea sp.]